MSQDNLVPPQKRKFFRLVYPLSFRPKVQEQDWEIVDISEGGASFRYTGKDPYFLHSHQQNLPNTVTFHLQNGKLCKIQGELIRCYCYTANHHVYFVWKFWDPLPYKTIYKEQLHIIRHFVNSNTAS